MNPVLEKLGLIGLVPVVKIEDPAKAENLAKALRDGGLPCAEITFRTQQAAEIIHIITQKFPDMLVGAGTVLNTAQAARAAAAGAQFIVSPGFSADVADYCAQENIPFVPGVTGGTDIQAALEKGLDVLKFFPAEAAGGTAVLDALRGPFEQVSFMPTGGISLKNLPDYIRCPNVLAAGGSWMVKNSLIEKDDWKGITALVREAVTAVHGFTLAHVGLNSMDEAEARKTAETFSLFGFPVSELPISFFNGDVVETMKGKMRGTNGHIAFRCRNVERALAYLRPFGFNPVEETAKRTDGKRTFVYLDREIGGFAIHLVQEM